MEGTCFSHTFSARRCWSASRPFSFFVAPLVPPFEASTPSALLTFFPLHSGVFSGPAPCKPAVYSETFENEEDMLVGLPFFSPIYTRRICTYFVVLRLSSVIAIRKYLSILPHPRYSGGAEEPDDERSGCDRVYQVNYHLWRSNWPTYVWARYSVFKEDRIVAGFRFKLIYFCLVEGVRSDDSGLSMIL